jgi:type IV secretory pathway TrbF-like protein
MSENVRATPDDPYRAADDSWRSALGRYIELARQGARRAVLRKAAMAVHEAALRKGLIAGTPEGTGH